jgi:predicted anti-sigma-YlaC factor YlaD
MKPVKSIMRKLKMSCADTSLLISERMDHSLPLMKRLRVGIHLAMCEVCRYYENQLKVLRKLAQHLGREEGTTEARLSPQARDKIQKRLDNEI